MNKNALVSSVSSFILCFVLFLAVDLGMRSPAHGFWSIDSSTGRDWEEQRCFESEQSAYNVAFGLAEAGYAAVLDVAKEKQRATLEEIFRRHDDRFSRVDTEEANGEYAEAVEHALAWYQDEISAAARAAEEGVKLCKQRLNDEIEAARKAAEAARRAEEEAARASDDNDDEEDDYSEDEDENDRARAIDPDFEPFGYQLEDDLDDDSAGFDIFSDDLDDLIEEMLEEC